MSDLTDFLLARIAEDEAAARDALEQGSAPEPEPWLAVGWPRSEHPGPVVLVGPERFLAECEAKRRIVEAHPAGRESRLLGTVCDTCAAWDEADYEGPGEVAWPCPTLRLLATVYADHPAFREDWRI